MYDLFAFQVKYELIKRTDGIERKISDPVYDRGSENQSAGT